MDDIVDLADRSNHLSLITVSYNSARTLEQCWAAGLPRGVEWIVVDNNSNDDSAATAERLGARVIRLNENLGFAKANNIGLATVTASTVGFVNPDVVVTDDSLDAILVEVNRLGGAVGPQLLNSDGSRQSSGRGYPTLQNKFRNRLAAAEDPAYCLSGQTGQARQVSWLMGAAIFATVEDVRRIGGWDQRYFLYYEDADFCLRFWNAGLPVHLTDRVNMVHHWGRETAKLKWAPWKREIASAVRFYWRWPYFLLPNSLARVITPKRLRAWTKSV